EEVGLGGERAAELDALLQPIRQPPHRNLADLVDAEKADDLLDRLAMLDLLALRWPPMERLPEEIALHPAEPAGHDGVEQAHALEERDVLEGAGDAHGGRLMWAHLATHLALVDDLPFLRLVKAVDAVEHRALACSVRSDDGADLAFANVEGHVRKRAHPAEGE